MSGEPGLEQAGRGPCASTNNPLFGILWHKPQNIWTASPHLHFILFPMPASRWLSPGGTQEWLKAARVMPAGFHPVSLTHTLTHTQPCWALSCACHASTQDDPEQPDRPQTQRWSWQTSGLLPAVVHHHWLWHFQGPCFSFKVKEKKKKRKKKSSLKLYLETNRPITRAVLQDTPLLPQPQCHERKTENIAMTWPSGWDHSLSHLITMSVGSIVSF